jgi:8-oxo-dGTP diphosphatase
MASKPPDSKLIKAAGAVAWRPGAGGGETQVMLVHRTKYDDWSLPKGKQETGEPLPLTASREVLEEGGARLVLGRRLISVRYNVSGRPKRVHYWSARVAATDEDAVPNAEVDQVAWLPVARAREQASYARDHGVLDDFARLPAGTVPLILLRHAKALPKSGWKHSDLDRPLDDSGWADAKALAGILASFAPSATVISSAAVRCVETVRPYAEFTGAQIRVEESLEPSRTASGESIALIADAVVCGEPTVLCAHRENLPSLLAAAADMLGASHAPDERDGPLPTAGFYVLHAVDGAFVAADRYDLSEALVPAAGRLDAARSRRRRSRTAMKAPSSATARTRK